MLGRLSRAEVVTSDESYITIKLLNEYGQLVGVLDITTTGNFTTRLNLAREIARRINGNEY